MPGTSSHRLVRRRQRRREEAEHQPIPCPPLPFDSRRRRSLSGLPGVVTEQSSSLFFTRLPPELRRFILIETFGDRTLHLDLQYRHPFASDVTANGPLHAGLRYDYRRYCVAMDTTDVPAWRWFGSVCHDYGQQTFAPPRPFGFLGALSDDRCLSGHGSCQIPAMRDQDHPQACFIGALGWLLSCRQA